MSATFPRPVRDVADRLQGEALHLEGTALGEANGDIDHVAQLVAPGQKYPALVNSLLLALGQQVLVFVDRRTDASDLAEMLGGDGFAALPFSGDLSQAQRTRTLHAFRSGTIQVLVSTDVAARGIDVPEISMVVHMSSPRDPEAYVHRSGRTGRAGRRGRSLLLVATRAQRHVTRLLTWAKIEADWQPVPTPAKVHKAITKRTRRQLHARLLAGADDGGPDEKAVQYATELLEGRDPAAVVAALLEMARPRLPREPMPIQAAVPLDQADRSTDRTPHRGKPSSRPSRRGPPGRPHRHGRGDSARETPSS
jgi:ATP-dependent RNA helicase DeaD